MPLSDANRSASSRRNRCWRRRWRRQAVRTVLIRCLGCDSSNASGSQNRYLKTPPDWRSLNMPLRTVKYQHKQKQARLPTRRPCAPVRDGEPRAVSQQR
ncbi:hypothetical protein M8494_05460 [Serratia ureilytica]